MNLTQAYEINDKEIDLLLEDLLEIHGYDFTNYSKASLRRRVNSLFSIDRFEQFSDLRYRLKWDTAYLPRFIEQVTVTVTEMFRDPLVWLAIRQKVLPILKNHPLIKIWDAGCSTGEEVHSLAILLKESGLLVKSIIYATDINPSVLETVRSGLYKGASLAGYQENYALGGGTGKLSQYYTVAGEMAVLRKELAENVIISTHNLVSDHSFNEFQLILCRNVIIYFDRQLQERVFRILDHSLAKGGFLVLGSKETLKFSSVSSLYQPFKEKEKIWRKI